LYQMQRFAEEGLTEEEIAAVTTRLRGIYLLNNETNISQAILLATAEMIGLGYGWVDEYMSFFDNVTPEDIKRVASEYFQNYTEVLITP
jgi:zinc protease